ncbi:hypothetical protein KR054_001616, partial [Drosophila jambulina]
LNMYIPWIVLFSSFALIPARWTPERIVGGEYTPISIVPWQASLQVDGNHHCGAVIYSKQVVITAAHCVVDRHLSRLTLRVGSSRRDSGGQLVKVSRVIVHESYNRPALSSNDVAVIRLQRPLKFNNKVRPIPLASSSPATGSPSFVAGWGAIGWKSPGSIYLLGVELSIFDHESCREAYGGNISNDMLCAAAPGKDSCSADSGGPLVSGGKLVGIVSFGIQCAHPAYPGVYADVAKLRPWILQAIQKINK